MSNFSALWGWSFHLTLFSLTILSKFENSANYSRCHIVSVTLKPLNCPDEPQRTLKINPTTKYIYVGRASKNATKGLVADENNAWFNSPIMSRQHAKFSISSTHKVSTNPYYLMDEIKNSLRKTREFAFKIVAQRMERTSVANACNLV